ncbi:hypothetical protein [Sulfuracidifex tepidarius]|uniref:hypothetical protein n=1 Tax=Sulfuracidifex tepidarius TaxID=1294262 RepID=UPI000B0FB49D|nr:hypothetical protein [Sulfuracidifex tepidarius]
MSEKQVVLNAIEGYKFDVMLAGIMDDSLLIVSKKETPHFYEENGKKYTIIHYYPDDYINLLLQGKEEEVFRPFHVYYFVKVYMRKVLDVLASVEVARMADEYGKNQP